MRSRVGDIGDYLEKGSNLGQRERKYAKTWGGGDHVRGQKSLQIHFYCIFLYLLQFISTPLSFLCTSKVATDQRIRNFNVLRTVLFFVLLFRHFLVFEMQ